MLNTGRQARMRFYLLLTASILSCTFSFAQSTNSPYSRYGIGNLNYSPFARNKAMGGAKIALDQPGFINYGNPASYSALYFTTYEGGSDFTQFEFATSTTEHHSHTAVVISYFDFAFPVVPQKWSVGFGLEPYSHVGYSIAETGVTDFGDTEIRKYEGSGGVNNFHMGTGFKVGKKLSAGFNVEYLFGTVENNRTVTFANPYYMNSALSSSTTVGWFHFTGGLQYKIDSLRLAKSDSIVMFEKKINQLERTLQGLINVGEEYEKLNLVRQEIAATQMKKDSVVNKKAKSDWRMVLGLTGSPVANLHATNTQVVNSFRYYSYAFPGLGTIYRDTVVNEKTKGNIRLPFSIGGGMSIVKGTQWIVAADLTYQQWSNFTYLDVSDSLDNSWKVSTGIQFTPNDRAVKSYAKTMQYRVGFQYEKGYIVLNDQNINDIAITAGFALPIKKGATSLHFSFLAGQRGTTKNDLIRERYFRFTFGFTINDRWFVRTKYD